MIGAVVEMLVVGSALYAWWRLSRWMSPGGMPPWGMTADDQTPIEAAREIAMLEKMYRLPARSHPIGGPIDDQIDD